MVLPKYSNAKYVDFNEGAYFGIIDIIGSIFHHKDIQVNNWFQHLDKLKRKFTVMSEASTSLLSLTLVDFNRLKLEFTDIYYKLIQDAEKQIEKVIQLKLIAIKKCAK